MARKAGVVLVAETAAYQRGMEQAVASAAALDGELKKLGVDAVASAEAQSKATARRIARLQEEAGALGRTAAAQVAAGESAVGSIAAQDQKLRQLARLQGEAGLSAQESAKLNVAATLSQIDAIDAQIVAYRELGAAAGTSAREQQIASKFGNEAAASRAALLGLPAPRRGVSAKSAGRGLTTYVTAPAAFLGYEAVKGAIDLNKKMLLLQTQAGASAAQVKLLNGQVLDLTKIAPQGPSVLAEGLFHLISLGVPAAHSIGVLRTASLAAGMGVANLEDTTSALGASVVSNIKGAQNYQHAMATLVATAGSGNMRFGDLAAAIGNVLPAAAASGVSLTETGAALAVMTDRGFSADEAATRLRMTLALIQRPSDSAKKALKDMGIDADSLGAVLRQPGGLLKVLELLHGGIDKVGKVRGNRDLLAAFGGGRSGLGIQTLVQSLDNPLSSFSSKLKQIGQQEKNFGANQKAYLASPAYQLANDWAQAQAELVKLGATLAPIAVKILTFGSGIAGAFNKLPGFIKKDLGTVVAILGVGGPLLLAGTKVRNMVRGIAAAFRLLPLSAGPAIAATDAELATVGTSAVAAEGKVAALRLSLMSLGGISLAGLAVGLAGYEAYKKIKALHIGEPHGGTISGLNKIKGGGDVFETGGQWYLQKPGAPNKYIPISKEKAGELLGGNVDTSKSASPGLGPHHGAAFQRSIEDANKTPSVDSVDHRHRLIKDFVLPYQIQLDQARAQTTKSTADDLAAAREVVAYAKKQIDSGRLSHKAMLAAMQEEASAQQQLWGAQTAANKEAAKKAQNFTLPMKLQLAQARADAIAAGITNLQGPTRLQLKLARQEKTAAQKALKGHNLTIQAMIDAWGVIGQANSVLAQAAANKSHIDTYHAVSTAAVTKGLGLTHEQDMALRERLAQRAAHRGEAPNGPAIEGHVVGGEAVDTRTRSSRGGPRGPVDPGGRNSVPNVDIAVRLVGDLRKFISAVEAHQRLGQRAGGRR